MTKSRNPLIRLIARFAAKLRFPQLFALTAILFLLDLAVPDAIPFADEILLALATLLLGMLRKRDGAEVLSGTSGPRAAGPSR